MQALNVAATGMLAQQTNVEVISNNIANMNTTGFKRHRAEFQDLLYQDLRRVGTNSSDAGTIVPSGIQLGVGVRLASTYRINEQGALVLTDNPFDLAIRGDGFFQVQLPDGSTAYTRAGSFQVNQAGNIVTPDGYTVLPGITVPAATTSVTVNQSGQVLATLQGQVAEQNLGTITLARFQNPAASITSATTCCRRPRRRARPPSATRVRTASAQSSRASLRAPTSIRCTKSPTSSPPSEPTS